MRAVAALVFLTCLLVGATIGYWPWLLANGLAGDVIRDVSLSVPIFGAITLWWLKKTDDRERGDRREAKRQRRLLVALRAEIDMQVDQHLEQFGAEVAPVVKANLVRACARPGKDSDPCPSASSRRRTTCSTT